MIDNAIICKKLEILLEYYKEFKKTTENISYEDYKDKVLIKRTIEREIQLIVECATDINNMILKGLKKGPSQDYFNSFINLGENNVLDMEFVLKIAPSTGLRNILVHQYQEIDDKVVYGSIDNVISYYHKYLKNISDYLRCNLL